LRQLVKIMIDTKENPMPKIISVFSIQIKLDPRTCYILYPHISIVVLEKKE
jgi:hypothetical protein